MVPRPQLAILVLSALVSLSLLPEAALAQGPPIQTDTPIMLGLQGRGVRTFLKVIRKDKLLQNGDEIPDPSNRTATTLVMPLIIPYNLTPTFQIGAVVPFVVRNLDTTAGSTDRSGLGDLSLSAKKLLVQVDRRAETFRIAVKGRVKLPTGADDGTLPLGSGSTDYGASAVAGWIKGRWGLYGEALFVHNTANGDVDYGDRYGFNVAVGFRAVPGVYRTYPSKQLNLFLELNGTSQGHTTVDGIENPNSGGALVYLSPGIQYVGGRRWLVEGSVQLPVVDDPNGTQLGTSWTTSIGGRVLIF